MRESIQPCLSEDKQYVAFGIDRAGALGYKAKQGIIVVRVRVRKGDLNRPRLNKGRRPKRIGVYGYAPAKSTRRISRLER